MHAPSNFPAIICYLGIMLTRCCGFLVDYISVCDVLVIFYFVEVHGSHKSLNQECPLIDVHFYLEPGKSIDLVTF